MNIISFVYAKYQLKNFVFFSNFDSSKIVLVHKRYLKFLFSDHILGSKLVYLNSINEDFDWMLWTRSHLFRNCLKSFPEVRFVRRTYSSNSFFFSLILIIVDVNIGVGVDVDVIVTAIVMVAIYYCRCCCSIREFFFLWH